MSKFNSIVPTNIETSTKIQESGKNSGGYSLFTCPDNTVMVGRYHKGDENGDTQYKYSDLLTGDNISYYNSDDVWQSSSIQESGKNRYEYVKLLFNDQFVITKNHKWSAWMRESGKNRGGCSEFICPPNTVLTGREHKGDENGDTCYRYSEIYIKGNGIDFQLFTTASVETDPIKESSGKWSTAPENKVMSGRWHKGDENGKTTYTYSYVYYKTDSSITTKNHKWSAWMRESGKNSGGYSKFICPPNTVLTGREHKGDENGDTRCRYSSVYLDNLPLEVTNGGWSDKTKEFSGIWDMDDCPHWKSNDREVS